MPTSITDRLAALPRTTLGDYPTPVGVLDRFRKAAGLSQQILIKRDDAISFGFGGNKVRKLQYVIPELGARGVDTVITTGGVQSNHARATAAAAAAAGMACHIVVNGERPDRPAGNALLAGLLGATFEYVAGRPDRAPAMERATARFTAEGRRPAIVPLGASTPVGALGFVAAIGEMLDQQCEPDVIVHACSSGGTSAGLLAGVVLHRLRTRVIGISADDPPEAVAEAVRSIAGGLSPLLGLAEDLSPNLPIEVNDGFVGSGYGNPTPASEECQRLLARTEGIFVDHTYTAKALAGLVQYCRDGRIADGATVLFWHTGGQVALFA